MFNGVPSGFDGCFLPLWFWKVWCFTGFDGGVPRRVFPIGPQGVFSFEEFGGCVGFFGCFSCGYGSSGCNRGFHTGTILTQVFLMEFPTGGGAFRAGNRCLRRAGVYATQLEPKVGQDHNLAKSCRSSRAGS